MPWLLKSPALWAGIAVAAVVGAWPQGPLWRSGPQPGVLQSFSPDGNVLVTTHVDWTHAGYVDPELSRWDADSGILLSRARFPRADANGLSLVRASPDGRVAAVGEGKMLDPRRGDFITGVWHLHDGITGARLTGPIAGVAVVGSFSPDGRWFHGTRGDPDGGHKPLGSTDVFSAVTGQMVAEGLGLFAADGNTMLAIDFAKRPEVEVRIIELPSGREVRRARLPRGGWANYQRWDGRYLVVTANKRIGKERSEWRKTVFDVSQDPVSVFEDPLAFFIQSGDGSPPGGWEDGPGWIAYFNRVESPTPRTGLHGRLEKLAIKIGFAQELTTFSRLEVRFVDRSTGATRWETPRPLAKTILFSPDGRRLACQSEGDDCRIEVWATDPWPRWWKAVSAGAVAAALALVGRKCLGRSFRKSI